MTQDWTSGVRDKGTNLLYTYSYKVKGAVGHFVDIQTWTSDSTITFNPPVDFPDKNTNVTLQFIGKVKDTLGGEASSSVVSLEFQPPSKRLSGKTPADVEAELERALTDTSGTSPSETSTKIRQLLQSASDLAEGGGDTLMAQKRSVILKAASGVSQVCSQTASEGDSSEDFSTNLSGCADVLKEVAAAGRADAMASGGSWDASLRSTVADEVKSAVSALAGISATSPSAEGKTQAEEAATSLLTGLGNLVDTNSGSSGTASVDRKVTEALKELGRFVAARLPAGDSSTLSTSTTSTSAAFSSSSFSTSNSSSSSSTMTISSSAVALSSLGSGGATAGGASLVFDAQGQGATLNSPPSGCDTSLVSVQKTAMPFNSAGSADTASMPSPSLNYTGAPTTLSPSSQTGTVTVDLLQCGERLSVDTGKGAKATFTLPLPSGTSSFQSSVKQADGTFLLIMGGSEKNVTVACSFLDTSKASGSLQGAWAVSGCSATAVSSSDATITCGCDHLTEFAAVSASVDAASDPSASVTTTTQSTEEEETGSEGIKWNTRTLPAVAVSNILVGGLACGAVILAFLVQCCVGPSRDERAFLLKTVFLSEFRLARGIREERARDEDALTSSGGCGSFGRRAAPSLYAGIRRWSLHERTPLWYALKGLPWQGVRGSVSLSSSASPLGKEMTSVAVKGQQERAGSQRFRSVAAAREEASDEEEEEEGRDQADQVPITGAGSRAVPRPSEPSPAGEGRAPHAPPSRVSHARPSRALVPSRASPVPPADPKETAREDHRPPTKGNETPSQMGENKGALGENPSREGEGLYAAGHRSDKYTPAEEGAYGEEYAGAEGVYAEEYGGGDGAAAEEGVYGEEYAGAEGVYAEEYGGGDGAAAEEGVYGEEYVGAEGVYAEEYGGGDGAAAEEGVYGEEYAGAEGVYAEEYGGGDGAAAEEGVYGEEYAGAEGVYAEEYGGGDGAAAEEGVYGEEYAGAEGVYAEEYGGGDGAAAEEGVYGEEYAGAEGVYAEEYGGGDGAAAEEGVYGEEYAGAEGVYAEEYGGGDGAAAEEGVYGEEYVGAEGVYAEEYGGGDGAAAEEGVYGEEYAGAEGVYAEEYGGGDGAAAEEGVYGEEYAGAEGVYAEEYGGEEGHYYFEEVGGGEAWAEGQQEGGDGLEEAGPRRTFASGGQHGAPPPPPLGQEGEEEGALETFEANAARGRQQRMGGQNEALFEEAQEGRGPSRSPPVLRRHVEGDTHAQQATGVSVGERRRGESVRWADTAPVAEAGGTVEWTADSHAADLPPDWSGGRESLAWSAWGEPRGRGDPLAALGGGSEGDEVSSLAEDIYTEAARGGDLDDDIEEEEGGDPLEDAQTSMGAQGRSDKPRKSLAALDPRVRASILGFGPTGSASKDLQGVADMEDEDEEEEDEEEEEEEEMDGGTERTRAEGAETAAVGKKGDTLEEAEKGQPTETAERFPCLGWSFCMLFLEVMLRDALLFAVILPSRLTGETDLLGEAALMAARVATGALICSCPVTEVHWSLGTLLGSLTAVFVGSLLRSEFFVFPKRRLPLQAFLRERRAREEAASRAAAKAHDRALIEAARKKHPSVFTSLHGKNKRNEDGKVEEGQAAPVPPKRGKSVLYTMRGSVIELEDVPGIASRGRWRSLWVERVLLWETAGQLLCCLLGGVSVLLLLLDAFLEGFDLWGGRGGAEEDVAIGTFVFVGWELLVWPFLWALGVAGLISASSRTSRQEVEHRSSSRRKGEQNATRPTFLERWANANEHLFHFSECAGMHE
uniref:Uncharacterized protein n=1 Tax=Chromera velia CCMP2878 TaxID=1169474 RepID=A0A0G4HSL7_9ALVE|eukprot:Cvel_8287.t1-p1 / transcript=Cvel_8287.t1 / gene=Cvel_8287 / organism=Chromera_velia_CCMP2878 / gene_product=Trichohyalin, putative / transcript_product=Trichohyalin, putative / location=Cvel_scaffold454:75731-86745(+) / protein_length=1772 / sequence_SO=supercontig / SO=protein_coding / is_pseudo=false